MLGFLNKIKKPVKDAIFVQIASYRDPECQWTIKNLFEQADEPDKIFVGLCSQVDKTEDKDCFIEPYPRPKQVRETRVPAHKSLGVCWARHQAQLHYQGEDYVMMIDSHMRFVKGWDTLLIAMLKRCDSKKPFLTAYPPSYTPPNNLETNPKLTIQRLHQFDKHGDVRGQGVILESPPKRPIRGAYIAAGYVFAKGSVIGGM